MAQTVWYIRHGESVSNVRGVFAGGQDNTPLTANGRSQALAAGQKLASIKFDRIICSPLDRTKETASIIAKEVGFNEAGIITDDRLQEYDVGPGNGTPYEGATSKQLISFPGAEDPASFETRVRAALSDVKKYDGNILVVAHGGVGRLIHCMKANGNPRDFYDYPKYPNAEAAKLDLGWLK